MIDKKRLEEIKEKYNFRSIDRFVDVKLVNPQDLKWLIQQAEHVEEMEDKCNYLSDMNEMLVDLNGVLPDEPELYIKLKKENKRYRKALEAIYELAEYNEYDNTLEQIVLEVEEALEEDNEPIRAEVSE